ncbi:Dynein beta chain, ciliary [Amphibalanus amphitrite]|uniref:Dynein beta chain, ciliary n=1 Tax=Amphibalanus amphitrite TaxID=1232801 RepID=A0A6A4VYY1_AMPAM|nr:Dynein beta chain, ciliary [Amphibalanus amphitrite]
MDKEVRAWDTYLELEATVKNMLTSLKAVSELQNPAIRTRHWKQLMVATKVGHRGGRCGLAGEEERGGASAVGGPVGGASVSGVAAALSRLAEGGDDVKFVMDENTTLADLLALNLHEFEDEVKNIVDKAVKEMSMEKVLKELDATWTTMEFEHDKHDRTGLMLLRASEELIETLEDNQVQLQNLMTSKYISFFLEEVSTWQKKLSMADQVISIWFEVQRTWSHLESIFIGSEDIRQQLPEDSKRFDEIDTKFKVLVKDINVTSNVVGATNQEGLYERLEALQGQLTLCEKALAEYLETKRLAFPRFYFVSSADLLDILSNGNQPELVAKHLTKLFDSMAKLKFKESGSTVAVGMWAKDGEYVEFDQAIDCVGPVEQWLNKLLDRMRCTVRYYMTEAVVTYEDKPREQWLFDYPAQVSLAGTQIWWTTEVNISFGRLEEGYENALKDYNKKQINQLNSLITLLVGDLTKQERQKVTTICTIDVHSRDVVGKLIAAKVESSQAFSWQAQLRHRSV